MRIPWALNDSKIIVLVASLFFCVALIFHWLGPVCGGYDFVGSVDVFFWELARGGWLTLLSLSMCLQIIFPRLVCGMNSWGIYCVIACFISGFLWWFWGQGQAWWSALAMVLMIFFSLLQVGIFVFLRFCFFVLLGYLAVGYSFTILKAAVFLRGVAFDSALVQWDLCIFGVDLYKVVSSYVQRSVFLMSVVDEIYSQLFVFMVFNVIACAYLGGQGLVRCYALALMLCYVLGVLGYLLLPAYGPFVHDPETFAHGWSNGPWQVADIQRFILQRTLEAARCTQPQIAPFAFVAAMPSLHVAVPTLGLVMSRGGGLLRCLMLVPLLLTAFAAVATGMHYGVDLLAGVALATISGWFARKLLQVEGARTG